MKQVKRRTWFCLVFTALLTLGILLFLARYFTIGGDWASFSANKHIYDKSGQLISGAVLDRTGTVLYDAASGAYSDDKIIRQATLHAVGDRRRQHCHRRPAGFQRTAKRLQPHSRHHRPAGTMYISPWTRI